MMLEYIASRQNSLVKRLKRLADNKRARIESGLILSEGVHLLRTMRDAGVLPELIAISERLADAPEVRSLLADCHGVRSVRIADVIFDQIAPTDSPSGVLTLSPMQVPTHTPKTDVDTLVLENVQDPGNVGSLIRTAVAAGLRQVVLSAGCADAWSPRCLRAAQGAPWLATVYTDHDVGDFLDKFTGRVAATVLNDGQNLYEQDLLSPNAWLFGNEGQGLSKELAARATCRISIPMPGAMESLNVNAAAAVCLFEQVRQRSSLAG